MEQFSISLSKELGPRQITVNTVAPALVDTSATALPGASEFALPAETVAQLVQQTPPGRLGLPEDIANLVAFLVSEQGGWITGQHLRSSGGLA